MIGLASVLSAPAADAATFSLPSINYYAIAPILIVFGAAVVSVLIEAFVPRRARRPIQLVLVIGSLLAALVVVVDLRGTRLVTGDGAIAVDGPTLILWGTLLVVGNSLLLLAFPAMRQHSLVDAQDRAQLVK